MLDCFHFTFAPLQSSSLASIDPNQIQEALNASLGLKAEGSASAVGQSAENDQAKAKMIVFEPQTGFLFERVTVSVL
jgi:hypothetical protein